MSPELETQQLNAFVDGELDLNSQLEIEARLAQDAGLRAQVEALRGLRQAVMRHADYHAAPAALRAPHPGPWLHGRHPRPRRGTSPFGLAGRRAALVRVAPAGGVVRCAGGAGRRAQPRAAAVGPG